MTHRAVNSGTGTKRNQTKRTEGKRIRTNGKAKTARGQSERWRGEEVEPKAPAGQTAEEAAARAEGHAPVTAGPDSAPAERGAYLPRGPARRPPASTEASAAENAEEKRQNAAEDHARKQGRGPMHGGL